MTENEIRKLAWDKMKVHPTDEAVKLAVLTSNEMLQRIIREIERSAKAVDAGVSKPNLWELAKYITSF